MALSGNLKDFDIANIFQIIAQENKSGILQIISKDNEGNVIFSNGMIIYVYTSHQNPQKMLLRYLMEIKKYSPAEINELQSIYIPNSTYMCNELLNKGYLSENEFREILENAIVDITCSLFSWKSGEYKFETLTNTDRYRIRNFAMPANAVAMEAARQNDELARIKEIIKPTTVFILSNPAKNINTNFDQVDLTNFSHYLLTKIDGTASVELLAKESFFSEYQVYYALFELLQLNEIIPLSAKFTTTINEAIKRSTEDDETKISKLTISSIITVALIFISYFCGNILLDKLVIDKKIPPITYYKLYKNTEQIKSENKLYSAKIIYNIFNGKKAKNLQTLENNNLIHKKDIISTPNP